MGIQVSPGIATSEVDLTTVVPGVATTAAGIAGAFQWGPVNSVYQVSNEQQLVNKFGQPNSNTANPFMTAASFLAYGNNLYVVRAANNQSYNATSNGTSININNEAAYQYTYLLPKTNGNAYGPFAARYPSTFGNSITVSIADAGSYSNTWNVNGINVSSYFPVAPGTSIQCGQAGGANDEVHIIVMDTGGAITGVQNTVLETYSFLSKASDSISPTGQGTSNYYKNVLFNNSQYIYSMDPPAYSTTANTSLSNTWGSTSATSFAVLPSIQTSTLSGGTFMSPTTADLETAYSYFINKDNVPISLLITADATTTVQQYCIDNISTVRTDCVAFLSPPYSAVVNQSGNEVANIQTWLNQLSRSTSYAFVDSGWKYIFDKYNNVYRWVPLNGDIAGLCVYTDSVSNPWFSPAGFNRGNIKNAVKLAWTPSQSQRDTIYPLGVNPVVSFSGQGIVLYGDKTLQSKPSAFDRINVRRLFIVLEQSIATAAKYSMFEFNDPFTRAQFVSLLTPFLSGVKGSRGITDFLVVCDTTNNTQQVIDSNQFVGDIYIKPARSINYIQLNFVAVATGVSFSTVVASN